MPEENCWLTHQNIIEQHNQKYELNRWFINYKEKIGTLTGLIR